MSLFRNVPKHFNETFVLSPPPLTQDETTGSDPVKKSPESSPCQLLDQKDNEDDITGTASLKSSSVDKYVLSLKLHIISKCIGCGKAFLQQATQQASSLVSPYVIFSDSCRGERSREDATHELSGGVEQVPAGGTNSRSRPLDCRRFARVHNVPLRVCRERGPHALGRTQSSVSAVPTK